MLSDSLQAQAQAIADAYQPPPTGRPSAIGDVSTVQKVMTALREGCYLETAAKLAGLSKVTLYDWKKRGEADEEPYKTFLNAVEKAEADAECDAIRNVRQAGKLPQFWAAEMTYLERRHPERWGRRTEDSSQPRVVVQIGVKDSDVQISVSTSSDAPSHLSPPLTADIHSLSADVNTVRRLINSHSVTQAEPDPPGDLGARSLEGPTPVPARVQRGRRSPVKSRVAAGKEKKA